MPLRTKHSSFKQQMHTHNLEYMHIILFYNPSNYRRILVIVFYHFYGIDFQNFDWWYTEQSKGTSMFHHKNYFFPIQKITPQK